MRTTNLPSGEAVPVLGQGTWGFGENPDNRLNEIEALRFGIDSGMKLIDTAEMYSDGAAEELVGKAISGRRSKVFLVSKMLPQHATRQGTITACEESLRRLGTDHLDMYLLHGRGQVPLTETLEAFDELVRKGKIRYWGVSNFDINDLVELDQRTPVPLRHLIFRTVNRAAAEHYGAEYSMKCLQCSVAIQRLLAEQVSKICCGRGQSARRKCLRKRVLSAGVDSGAKIIMFGL